MSIKIYNTAKRKKVVFEPLDPSDVRMYVCGPTVYDRAHLGNARPVLVFDILFRLLRHDYGADHVKYVRNFTDVDDRINATALARSEAGDDRSLEALIHERSDETIKWYRDDMEALGALQPDEEPRATEFIGAMVAMIEGLVAKGHAYEAEGHVLFAVESYADYGALSGRSIDDMIAGARVEVAPYKRNPMDFVLWKPSTDDLPGWAGPVLGGKSIGRGRPGWHIECSAMANELLGTEFDIHGGGNDLTFPHHENEIAQSVCSGHGFARYWMHNEMLQVEGRKMSKSLGNFFTVRDLLDGRGLGRVQVPGEVIRFVMLSTHYRKPMDWTEKKRADAEKTLLHWHQLVDGVEDVGNVDQGVVDALSDDLNISGAMTRLHQMAKNIAKDGGKNCHVQKGVFLSSIGLLGLFDATGAKSTEEVATDYLTIRGDVDFDIGTLDRLSKKWSDLRRAENYAEADRLKTGIENAGLTLSSTNDGPVADLLPEFDFKKLEALK